MNKNNYAIEFYDGESKIINAWNEKEAAILAQALRIQEGLDYNIKTIKKIKRN